MGYLTELQQDKLNLLKSERKSPIHANSPNQGKSPSIKAAKAMKSQASKSTAQSYLLIFAIIAVLSSVIFTSEIYQKRMATLGGICDAPVSAANSAEIDSLARFAVDEHNKKQNGILEFARVVKAKEQVVAGTMHHLTIEAIDAGKKMLFEAKVWVKPWLNFKELQEFKHAAPAAADDHEHEHVPRFTSSDLGVKRDGHHGPGWKAVPVHDPAVQDAANHALKTIQQRSNSLFPYELREVVHANAEVVDDTSNFDMLLKVKRGTTEEKLKVEVHQNNEGDFHLNRMEPHV